jgi:hypothetical protein
MGFDVLTIVSNFTEWYLTLLFSVREFNTCITGKLDFFGIKSALVRNRKAKYVV